MFFSLGILMFLVAIGLLVVLAMTLIAFFKGGLLLIHHASGILLPALMIFVAIVALRATRFPPPPRPHGPPPLPHHHSFSDHDHQSSLLSYEEAIVESETEPDAPPGSNTGIVPAATEPASPPIASDAPIISTNPLEVSAQPLSVVETLRDPHGKTIQQRTVTEIPVWTQAVPSVREHSETWVLHSERFATEQEAREQLAKVLERELAQRFHHQWREAGHFPIRFRDLEHSGLIHRECVVTWPLAVGAFQESVVQIHWQLKFTSYVEKAFLAVCQQKLVRHRLGQLGGGVVVFSLLLTAGSWIAFRRART